MFLYTLLFNIYKKYTEETNKNATVVLQNAKKQFESDEYNYLHKCPVHTMKFQKSLPRLPIPNIEDTCRRYLESQRALTDDVVAYRKTVQMVNHFMRNEGVR